MACAGKRGNSVKMPPTIIASPASVPVAIALPPLPHTLNRLLHPRRKLLEPNFLDRVQHVLCVDRCPPGRRGEVAGAAGACPCRARGSGEDGDVRDGKVCDGGMSGSVQRCTRDDGHGTHCTPGGRQEARARDER